MDTREPIPKATIALHLLLFVAAGILLETTFPTLLRPLYHLGQIPELQETYGPGGEGDDILFLGDSTLVFTREGEADQASIAEHLDGLRPRDRVRLLAQEWWRPTIYDGLLALLTRLPKRPRILVVEVNLRSFSAITRGNPYAQRLQHQVLLRGASSLYLPHKFLHAFGIPSPRETIDAYERRPIRWEGRVLGTVGDLLATRERGQRWYQAAGVHQYGEPLPADHEDLIALERLLRRAREMELDVLVYSTPINFQAFYPTCGPALVERIRQSLERIQRVAVDGGAGFLDLTTTVPRPRFIDLHEHLDGPGRQEVARMIQSALEEGYRR